MLERIESKVFVAHIPMQKAAVLVFFKECKVPLQHGFFIFVQVSWDIGKLFIKLCFFVDRP